MRSHHPRPPVLLALLAIALAPAVVACGGGEGAAPTATAPATAGPTGTPGAITLTIVSPEEGANVTNSFTVRAQATGVQIAAASEGVPGAAHFHAFLDQEPVAEGELIPSGAGIFHFTDSAGLRAGSGQHTIVVVLGDNDHVRLEGAPTARVTVTVGEID